MRISLQRVVQREGVPATVTEIAQFASGGVDVGSLGLHLEEAKSLLGSCPNQRLSHVRAQTVNVLQEVLPRCASRHLGFMLILLLLESSLRPRLDLRLRFGQRLRSRFAPCDLRCHG